MWIGSLRCRVRQRGSQWHKAVTSQRDFHLVLSKTATLRMTTSCRSCPLEGLFNATKILLTQVNCLVELPIVDPDYRHVQFVEMEVAAGAGRTIEFYNEPPLIGRSNFSLVVHLRNPEIDGFDFKLVAKLGARFHLSAWAQDRSLLVPHGSDLTVSSISPRSAGLIPAAARRNCSVTNRFQVSLKDPERSRKMVECQFGLGLPVAATCERWRLLCRQLSFDEGSLLSDDRGCGVQ